MASDYMYELPEPHQVIIFNLFYSFNMTLLLALYNDIAFCLYFFF